MKHLVCITRCIFIGVFVVHCSMAVAQHPTRNPKFHKSIIKSFCENCTLPVDYETGLIEYTEAINSEASQQQLRSRLYSLGSILSANDPKRILRCDTLGGVLRMNAEVDLYGGSSFNGIKKLGVCQYLIEVQLNPKGYRYRINTFTMQGSNRRLHAYLEALGQNVRLQTQATYCVIEAIEGVYMEDGTYRRGIIDLIVEGMLK